MTAPSSVTTNLLDLARSSRQAAQQLALLSGSVRQRALEAIAQKLMQRVDAILDANQKDLTAAGEMVKRGELSDAAYARLKLSPTKLETMVASVKDVAQLSDPIGRSQFVRELDEGLILEQRTCPLGVLGIIFESRPDAVTQIASLAIKTGNSVLLKGGSEAIHSCSALVEVIHQGLAAVPGVPLTAVQLLTTREEIRALLDLSEYVDLIVPRGSQSLVRFIQANTRIPVLGHADGICHLYVDAAADADMATRLAVDSKVQYPAACNAIETLLVHESVAPTLLPQVAKALQREGVKLKGCDQTRQHIHAEIATPEDWSTEYGDLILSIKVISSLAAALEHIEKYGSRHTESIVTEDPDVAHHFLESVDAAGVFHNASTRFADGYRYGFGAEVGISTQKMPPRGPVGIDGLVTYKYQLRGRGQVVADYTGVGGRSFTHRNLPEFRD